jgi:hypothetical protein
MLQAPLIRLALIAVIVSYLVTNEAYKEQYLLGCNAVKSVESQPTFRGNMSPPSSGSNNISQARNQPEAGSSDCHLLHAGFLLDLQYSTLKMEVTCSPETSWPSTYFMALCPRRYNSSWPSLWTSNHTKGFKALTKTKLRGRSPQANYTLCKSVGVLLLPLPLTQCIVCKRRLNTLLRIEYHLWNAIIEFRVSSQLSISWFT